MITTNTDATPTDTDTDTDTSPTTAAATAAPPEEASTPDATAETPAEPAVLPPDFLGAITTLTAEKNLPEAVVFDAVEDALAAAYKRDYNIRGEVKVNIHRVTGVLKVWSEIEVVEIEEDIAEEDLQIEYEAAVKIRPDIQIGQTLTQDHTVGVAGRIAAQTAKQVVLQRLREAEREVVFDEYSGQEGDLLSGVVQRLEARQVIIDLGRTEAVLPPSEQIRMEHYRPGQRVRVYLLEVLKGTKGPQVVVSRTHKNLIKRLFELEVPEIFREQVEIKGVAREAGHRTKVAVHSNQEGLDPVGACVGMRGIRIQNVVNELQGERIDVIQWDPDPRRYVAHALSPAQVVAVRLLPDTNTAEVAVPDKQLSLAIGKEGQNARLAARLTGLRIDIKPQSLAEKLATEGLGPLAPQPELPELVAPAPEPAVATVEAAAAVVATEPVVEEATIPLPERREVPPEQPDESSREEELEPAAAELEVAAPSSTEPGKIRFAEEVLARPAEEPKKQKKRRKVRYVETDDELEDDPYADYADEEE